MTLHAPKKLPTPKQLADNRWEVRWRYRLAGKEHRPRRVFPTEKEANAFILNDLVGASRTDPAASKQSFDAYADRYLETIAGDVKARTVERYRSALLHARAYFAGTQVAEIKTSDCRAFRAKLQKGGCISKRRNENGDAKQLRGNSVRNVYGTFRSVLELAAEDGALPANPAVLRRTAGRKSNRETKFKAVFLNAAQVEALAGVMPEPYGLMIRFLAYTGLRAGELAGLDVADVHLTYSPRTQTWRGYVDVHRTRRKVKGGWVEDTPKSEESTRRVTLPPWLAEDLHLYLTGNHERGDDPAAPLFPNRKPGATYTTDPETGKKVRGGFRLNWAEPIEPGRFYINLFKPALVRAGLLVATRLHDLRHTFAALFLELGGDIYRLSQEIGPRQLRDHPQVLCAPDSAG
ncbi:tyrosine-type recombinase/integrase [Paractinoplanes durhamensis]|uniref:Site-specific integrase n=1 Tax=Paractinoplanes durhamensis TaxID=113563 RepID=A0ABQ3ZBY7_9ACTN|nr:tyrosine-type recombinase/integrase [Actinoplanes durhamensis]GIE07296.1 site-specific integrase [Actinoplanes durhamensis]